jgi:KH domain-containing protein
MVQETYVESINKVLMHSRELEKELKVKIRNKGKLLFVEGAGDDEYLALEVVKALDLGFSMDTALQLKDEEVVFQVFNIKDLTRRTDLERIRARIIGVHGKALQTMETLTDCDIAVHDNKIGIIGTSSCIDEGIIAIKSIVQGSKHGNVYARLEKKKKEKRLAPKEPIKDEFKKKDK